VLQRTGLLTESQLHYAMRLAAQETAKPGQRRRSLGEICVDLGYLSAAELEAAVALQASDCVGVLDALGSEPLQSCVGKTGIRNLSILPLGGATAVHASKVCSNALRRTLETARQQYDTIIIDTCSILTGLEASIVASAVDGMVVTVARGEQHSRVHEALARLKTLSCPVAGIIFNQALAADTPFTTVDRMPEAHGPIMDEEGIEATMSEPAGRLATLGPLARVVISHVSSSHEGTD
jgi:MinD-like ATPase involved in chromosome partitioning or flagellar assembly